MRNDIMENDMAHMVPMNPQVHEPVDGNLNPLESPSAGTPIAIAAFLATPFIAVAVILLIMYLLKLS